MDDSGCTWRDIEWLERPLDVGPEQLHERFAAAAAKDRRARFDEAEWDLFESHRLIDGNEYLRAVQTSHPGLPIPEKWRRWHLGRAIRARMLRR